VKRSIYEATHYAIFSMLLPLPPSYTLTTHM